MKRLSKYFVCINQHSLVFGSKKKCKKGLKKKILSVHHNPLSMHNSFITGNHRSFLSRS